MASTPIDQRLIMRLSSWDLRMRAWFSKEIRLPKRSRLFLKSSKTIWRTTVKPWLRIWWRPMRGWSMKILNWWIRLEIWMMKLTWLRMEACWAQADMMAMMPLWERESKNLKEICSLQMVKRINYWFRWARWFLSQKSSRPKRRVSLTFIKIVDEQLMLACTRST